MASYEIPEEIIGTPLFVPDGNDYFEIVTAGMPNGDDCLRVRGDLSANYKAYQIAPTTSPNISANITEWALTMWLKGPTGSPPSAAVYTSLILSMMNANKASTGIDGNSLVSLSPSGTSGIQFSRGVTTTGTAVFQLATSAVFRDSTWHMITVNVPGTSSTGGIFLDNNNLASIADTQTSGNPPTATQYLCIGKYSNLAGPTAWAVDYQIGKIAFHDHMLNQTERSLLWEAMTT